MLKVYKNPRNALSEILKKTGLSRVEAIAGAERNLTAIRGDCLNSIQALLTQMQTTFRDQDLATESRLSTLYMASNDVYGIAGAVDLKYLALAAFSLCEILDQLLFAKRWNQAVIEVHIASLFALRDAVEHSGDCEEILKGLKRVVERAQHNMETVLCKTAS